MSTTGDRYSRISLSDKEIEQETYKQYLGGGAEKWKIRGAFQLNFLQRMGLQPSHTVLDIGCGPVRGGEHIIRYLEPASYWGVDDNRDFIRAAEQIVRRDNSLKVKAPVIRRVDNFEFSSVDKRFDYALAFSVLNHCNEDQRRRFLTKLPGVLKKESKTYITHAKWFTISALPGTRLRLNAKFNVPEDVSRDLVMEEWGWPDDKLIFPILELALA